MFYGVIFFIAKWLKIQDSYFYPGQEQMQVKCSVYSYKLWDQRRRERKRKEERQRVTDREIGKEKMRERKRVVESDREIGRER